LPRFVSRLAGRREADALLRLVIDARVASDHLDARVESNTSTPVAVPLEGVARGEERACVDPLRDAAGFALVGQVAMSAVGR